MRGNLNITEGVNKLGIGHPDYPDRDFEEYHACMDEQTEKGLSHDDAHAVCEELYPPAYV